jgi:outer membrane protein assembly factor BamD (BamD/ComL family)
MAVGCAPQKDAAYEGALAAASRDEGAGRFAEATADYDRAAGATGSVRDRDEARWDAAQTAARAGHVSDAATRLEGLANEDGSEHQAEATYRLGLMRIESGDADRGWLDLRDVVRRYPTHGVARIAVRHLVQHADERSLQDGLDEVHALERDPGASDLAPLLAYLAAQHVEALGDVRGARDAYLAIADRWRYPFGAFFDDALWHASLLDEKLGLYPAAIADLERLLRERESTYLVGSYERARYVPAALRIGELYRDRLHDGARARAAFHRLYTDFAHSTERDHALWLEAASFKDEGRSADACDRLATLVHEFPDSRYVPCATEECPAIQRPPKSAAPRDCHPYITRGAAAPAADREER